MTNIMNVGGGYSLEVQIGDSFIDKDTGKKSVVIDYFLKDNSSGEVGSCSIQFPQEKILESKNMDEAEVEAMLIFYDKFESKIWDAADKPVHLDDEGSDSKE